VDHDLTERADIHKPQTHTSTERLNPNDVGSCLGPRDAAIRREREVSILKTAETTANSLVTRFRAIMDAAAELANEKSKDELGESIWERGLRGWARSKRLKNPPEQWPRWLSRVDNVDGAKHVWQPCNWQGRPIGEPWQFKCDLWDLGPTYFGGPWGMSDDDRFWFEDDDEPDSLQDYFGRLGAVLDATVDPQRYLAILFRLPRGPTPPRAGPAAKFAA
jgi:hypothetical protein